MKKFQDRNYVIIRIKCGIKLFTMYLLEKYSEIENKIQVA